MPFDFDRKIMSVVVQGPEGPPRSWRRGHRRKCCGAVGISC